MSFLYDMGEAMSNKPNTCAPSSLHLRLERQLKAIQKHLEENPNDKLSAQRVATIQDALRRS
jgi:hypothetical protein